MSHLDHPQPERDFASIFDQSFLGKTVARGGAGVLKEFRPMVKHVVMLRLKDEAHGNRKEANARLIKEKVEALRAKIGDPGILRLEVGLDFSATEQSADVCIYSEFESRAALDRYQEHPEHQAILPFIAHARSERRLVDYEG